jgi:nucleotide-binding universal stress UspA family protein
MFKTVIVPLDGSRAAEAALVPATEVARQTGAALVPLMVVSDEHFEEHERYLKEQTGGLGVELQPPFIIPAADPAECIANAGEAPDSLVVMTTHGSSGLRRVTLGSVADKTVRLLRRPVLLVGPGCRPGAALRGGKMVIPVDGSRHSEAILPTAAAWCRAFDMEAWPVMVIDPDEVARDVGPSSDLAEAAHVRRVAQDLENQGVRSGWEVLHFRNAAGPLTTYALGLPASLVAMSTHGRTGLDRVTMGSVATRLVHDSACPVLVHRPEGLEQ